jgi:hypothetical protein
LGLNDFYLFLDSFGSDQKNKIRPISAFDSHRSIIPPFHYSINYPTAETTPLVYSPTSMSRGLRTMRSDFSCGFPE